MEAPRIGDAGQYFLCDDARADTAAIMAPALAITLGLVAGFAMLYRTPAHTKSEWL